MELFIKTILWLVISIVAIRLYKKNGALPETNETVVLLSLAVSYGILALIGLLLQHASFNTYAKDLAIYTQALNSWSLNSSILGRSLMANHFSPILFLFIPLGKLFNSPILLFVLQTIILILPIFPLYRIAKHFGLENWSAMMIVFIYLNYYFLRTLTLTDFHVELLMPLMMLLMVESFLAHHSKWFWIWLIACLMIKEDMGFYLAAWFLVISITIKQQRKLSLMVALICFVVGIVAVSSLLPTNQGIYPYFTRWDALGKGLFGIIFGAILQPQLSVVYLFKGASWSLLLPLLGLPMLTGWGWALLPTLWVQAASNYNLQAMLGAYYAAPVIPMVMIALIAGWKKIEVWGQSKIAYKKWSIVMVVFLIIFNLHWIPWHAVKKEHRQLSKILSNMPDKGTIFAQANIAPHISHSQRVRVLGMNSFKENPAVVIFHIKGNIWPFDRTGYLRAINQIRFNSNYKLWKDEAGAQIYIRTQPIK